MPKRNSLVLDAAAKSTTPQNKKKQATPRRDHKGAVQRAMDDHYGGLSTFAREVFEIDGLTLSARLDAEILRVKKVRPNGYVGADWYVKHFNMYVKADEQLGEPLTVKDQSQPVGAQWRKHLVKVADATNLTRKVLSGILAWLPVAPECNQRELVSVLRCVRPLKPSSENSQIFCIAVLKYLARHRLHDKFPNEVKAARTVFDQVLEMQYCKDIGKSPEWAAWWADWASLVDVVTARTKVEEVLDVPRDADFSQIAPKVAVLSAESRLLRKMFGFLQSKIASDGLRRFLSAALAQWGGKQVTVVLVLEMTTAAQNEIVRMSAEETLSDSRTIELEYRQVKIRVVVLSGDAEIRIRVYCWCKSRAVGNALSAMSWEQPFGVKLDTTKARIDAGVLEAAEKARASCNARLALASIEDGEALAAWYSENSASLLAIDDTFDIDMSFARAVTGAASVTFMQAVLDFELSVDADDQDCYSIPALANRLKVVREMPVFKFGNQQAQAIHKTVADIVGLMQRGHSAELVVFHGSPYLVKVKEALAKYCVTKDHKVQGVAAAKQMFDGCKKLKAEGKQITLAELSGFAPFRFLLSEADGATLQDWVTAAYSEGIASCAVGGSSGKASSSKRPGGKAKSKQAPARTGSAGLFD